MNGKSAIVALAFVAMFVLVASVAEAHKKLYSQAQFDGRGEERCVCDCGPGGPGGPNGPILPNKPYYGSAGYGQPAPRPSGGYGNQGSYAVSGSYGNGGGRVTGGY